MTRLFDLVEAIAITMALCFALLALSQGLLAWVLG